MSKILIATIPSTAAISDRMWGYWKGKYTIETTKTTRAGKHWLKIWGLTPKKDGK